MKSDELKERAKERVVVGAHFAPESNSVEVYVDLERTDDDGEWQWEASLSELELLEPTDLPKIPVDQHHDADLETATLERARTLVSQVLRNVRLSRTNAMEDEWEANFWVN